MKQRKIDITYENPTLLKANDWNTNVVSPDNEEKLENSLDRFGMFKPVLVRELSDGALEILGGEHRVRRAESAGMDQVPVVNLGKLSDQEAKEIGIIDNGRYGADDTLALAELLNSLDSRDTLTEFMPFSDTDMSSIFASTEIDLDDIDMDDDQDALPVPKQTIKTHDIMRFKVGVEDTEFVAETIEQIQNEQGLQESDRLLNAGDALIHLIKVYMESRN